MLNSSLLLLTLAAVETPCDLASQAIQQGNYPKAEQQAQACIEATPENYLGHYHLSRSLAFSQNYSGALVSAQKALSLEPQNGDLILWKSHVQAWSGNYVGARASIAKLPKKRRSSTESLRIQGRVELWDGNYPQAVEKFDQIIAQNPKDADALSQRGIAKQNTGEEEAAYQDLTASCSLGHDKACDYAEELSRKMWNWEAHLHPSFTQTRDQRTWLELEGGVRTRLTPKLHLGASLEFRSRDFGAERLQDLSAFAEVHYEALERLHLDARVGGALINNFSPQFYLLLEPSVIVGDRWIVSARYWLRTFELGSVQVMGPSVSFYWDNFLFSLRYDVGLRPNNAPTTHAVLGRARYYFQRDWEFGVGLGGGSGADNLAPVPQQADNHLVALGQVTWWLNTKTALSADYIFRTENSANRQFQSHQLIAGFKLRL